MTGICLWDWNGTLLDDARYALKVRNSCFPEFGLPKLNTMKEYREQFTFPVQEYYRRAGVTDAQFEQVANAWMAGYIAGCEKLKLRKGAKDAALRLKSEGIRQVILSASKIETLREQLSRFSIAPIFEELLGLGHIYATSKEQIGREYLDRVSAEPDECLLIGDSVHDAEVARALGIGCVLVEGGHQSRGALKKTGFAVGSGLREALELALEFFSGKA